MVNEIRYALRTLRKNPGFTITAIVSMALAIGASSAIFSLNDSVLLRPLPVADPSGLVTLRPVEPTLSSSTVNFSSGMSYADFVDFREKNQSFRDLTAYQLVPAGFARDAKTQPQLKLGFLATGNFFQLLGVEPKLGRGFRPEEDQVPGRDHVVVLSYDLWQQELGADPGIIGRNVRLAGSDYTVIGIAPESFTTMDLFVRPAFFIPVAMGPALLRDEHILTDRARRGFDVKGRLKPGLSLRAADDETAALARSLEQTYPATNRGFGAAVRTEMQVRTETRPAVLALVSSSFGLVGVVLLIACANVANLMLAKGRARAREVAVRLAIGASRRQIIRQLMIESLLIALAGGALGLLIADYAVQVFSTLEVISDASVRIAIQLDRRVLFFTTLVSVLSAVLFGLVPALRATKTELVADIKAGSVSTNDERRRRFFGQRALVIVQIAGSFIVMMAAAQIYRGVAEVLAAHPGFRRDHILTARFDPSLAGYNASQVTQFYKALINRSTEVPGLKSAALGSNLPLTSFCCLRKSVIPDGYQFAPGQKAISVLENTVDEHFFATLGVSILNGRGFLPTDQNDSPRVAVVNETFARKYLGENPIGKRIWLDDRNGPSVEVVGVAITGKYISINEAPTDFLYLPFSQNPQSRMSLIAESAGEPALLAGSVKELVGSIDPSLAVFSVHTMENVFYQGVKGLNLASEALASAALIGFFLALVGLYALMAYQVARKTREIGIRMALGAERLQVMRMILTQAGTIAALGITIGFALTMASGRALTMGRAANAFDPVLFVSIPLGLLLTTLLAAAVPALRAARIDPREALRQE